MFRRAARVTGKGLLAAGAAGAAGTTFLYYSDEKVRRAFDFSARITPLCCDCAYVFSNV